MQKLKENTNFPGAWEVIPYSLAPASTLVVRLCLLMLSLAASQPIFRVQMYGTGSSRGSSAHGYFLFFDNT